MQRSVMEHNWAEPVVVTSGGDFLRPGRGSESTPITEEFRETYLVTCDFLVLSIDSETIYSHLSPRLLAALRGRRRRLMLMLTLEQRLGPCMTRARVEGVLGFLGHCEAVRGVEIRLIMDEHTAEEPTYEHLPVGAWLAERLMSNFPNCRVLGFKPFLMLHSELLELLRHHLVVGRIKHLDIQTALLTGRERVHPFVWLDPALGLTSFYATYLGPLPVSLRDRPSNLVKLSVTEMYLTDGMVYQLPTLLPYTGDVYQPHELEQCRRAALAQGLTIFQLPQLAIDMAAVVAASILITRVFNNMVFSSVNANSKTQYGTGQRVQVVLAKSDKNSSGDLDTTLQLLSDNYNAAVYSNLSAEKKKQVDEAKEVLAQYLTLLQPVLKQLLGRPLNALATIITDPTWQRRLNRNGNMVTTLAKQLAQAQAPHTDFLPVGPGMDDGLVFLLALQDFPLVAYMGSHKLSQLAAAYCRRTADGQKQVVEDEDMDALALTLPHQLGTEVLVKAGQLVLFRGNTVHAGNVGVAGSCCARLYGFGRPDTVADNTTMNTSELGDLYHGLFQPIQDEGIGPKMADWNRRGMACQWDPVGVRQNPVDVGRRTL
ncbi:hypothetical protein V8C86DRAFT_3092061 [Haematococcus lacustris]